MLAASYIRIPLRRRNGTIRAYALVDREDEWITAWRWYLTKGYAGRIEKQPGPERPPLKAIILHRQLLGLITGDGKEVDHINGDPLDNRRANLRVLAAGQNQQNTVQPQRGSSKYRGVRWMPRQKRWYASARINGKFHHLGSFKDEREAADAARAFRMAHMPFANEDRHAA